MIIGLGYRARVGKDTAAEILWSKHGFTRVAFADSLKKACMEIFHLHKDQVYGDDKERPDPFWQDTPRNILQRVGTECLRRGYAEDVWVRSLERRIQRAGMGNDYVITDVRFPNEAEAVKRWGGEVVRVDRPKAPGIATATHASETAMDAYRGWDYVLLNDGTLETLTVRVDTMLRQL